VLWSDSHSASVRGSFLDLKAVVGVYSLRPVDESAACRRAAG
jgi:hypothetical protein